MDVRLNGREVHGVTKAAIVAGMAPFVVTAGAALAVIVAATAAMFVLAVVLLSPLLLAVALDARRSNRLDQVADLTKGGGDD